MQFSAVSVKKTVALGLSATVLHNYAAVAAETAAAVAVAAAAEAAETAAEASRELDALEKEAQKGQLSASEVVEAADALRARYGL